MVGVDGRAKLSAVADSLQQQSMSIAMSLSLKLDNDLDRLNRELRHAETASSPEKSCELSCAYLREHDEPLFQRLEDSSQWNRNYDSNQACCSLS